MEKADEKFANLKNILNFLEPEADINLNFTNPKLEIFQSCSNQPQSPSLAFHVIIKNLGNERIPSSTLVISEKKYVAFKIFYILVKNQPSFSLKKLQGVQKSKHKLV